MPLLRSSKSSNILSVATQKKKSKSLIEKLSTKNIPLSKIDLDPANPNKMTDAQMDALDKIMKKYHYATECWVNEQKNGRYKMIDGEHRYLILKRNNINTVPCKIFKVSEPQVKMLRQIANKFRGQHDFEKDALEFKAIYDDKKLQELSDLLVQPIEYFEKILEIQFKLPPSTESTMDITKKEWQNMPEFVANDQIYRSLVINFQKPEDVEGFAQLVGQTITDKTKSIWYPKSKTDTSKRYVDETAKPETQIAP